MPSSGRSTPAGASRKQKPRNARPTRGDTINTVSIIGRLTRDPELKQTPSGAELCSLRIAVDRAGPKEGDEIKAGFFDVTLWGKTAEVAARYLVKGRQVGISGELRWREWEAQDGTKRQGVEINGRNITFVGSKGDNDNDSGSSDEYRPPAPAVPSADDDIPF